MEISQKFVAFSEYMIFKKNHNPNDYKVIYNGLIGIAFGAQENVENNLGVTKFVNVQNHREWIEAIIYGKKNSLKIWSNGLNPDRMAKGNSMTAEMNISFMILFNLIFMLSFY